MCQATKPVPINIIIKRDQRIVFRIKAWINDDLEVKYRNKMKIKEQIIFATINTFELLFKVTLFLN